MSKPKMSPVGYTAGTYVTCMLQVAMCQVSQSYLQSPSLCFNAAQSVSITVSHCVHKIPSRTSVVCMFSVRTCQSCRTISTHRCILCHCRENAVRRAISYCKHSHSEHVEILLILQNPAAVVRMLIHCASATQKPSLASKAPAMTLSSAG